jgi:hypothetical protein
MRTYPNCGLGTLESIATILDPDAIARILGAIGRRSRIQKTIQRDFSPA